MARRNARLYTLDAVNKYMESLGEVALDVIEGTLLDDLIIYHAPDCIEVFEAVYLNEWSSAYARHIYRKGLPKRWLDALDEQYARDEQYGAA